MRLVIAIAIVAAAVIAAAVAFRPSGEDLPVVALKEPVADAPALCPWREPQRDMQAFFPGAAAFSKDLLVLTRLRPRILQRLGPGSSLESNALYVYEVSGEGQDRGTVLVERTAGRYGAIEVVVGVHPDGKVAGVRIQRQREPEATAKVLTSSSWLSAFRGKTADSGFALGEDLPDVPAEARDSAQAVAQTVRSLLVQYDEGKAAVAKPHH